MSAPGSDTVEVTEEHKKLAGLLGLGASERIMQLWAMLCSPEEAGLLLALPATADELAAKTGRDAGDVQKALDALFVKGVVFEREKDGAITYNRPKNFVQFHDASILWPQATQEFIDLWKEFMDEEYPAFLNMLGAAGLGPFLRVIPIKKALHSRPEVLPYEHAAQMIQEASALAVTNCTCRLTQKKCDGPLEVCLQINRGAEYAIKRGTGRALTKDEALAVLDVAEEAGLIHLSENRARAGNVICNCCTCCCMAMEPLIHGGNKAFAAPSRYRAAIDAAACENCGDCIERCPASAISPSGETHAVDPESCIGCGLCMSVCPADAIELEQVQPPEFIP